MNSGCSSAHGKQGNRLGTSSSWFAIDGALPSIDYAGEAHCRYPEALVEEMIARHTRPGHRILDPFCGFGTTLAVAGRMERQAVGFECDRDRYDYARRFA